MSQSISPPPIKRRKVSPKAQTLTKSDTSSPPDKPDTIRIFAWNINGIAPFLQSSTPQNSIAKYFTRSPVRKSTKRQRSRHGTPAHEDQLDKEGPADLRLFLQRHHWPHILLLQEVKISPDDKGTQKKVHRAVNRQDADDAEDNGPAYSVHFTLPRDPHNARGLGGKRQVYGIASMIRDDISSSGSLKVRDVVWDLEGRIHVIELHDEEKDFKLAVVNVYAVNGTDNAYRDPRNGAIVGTRHDRKLEVHRLLMEECLHMEKDGWRVIIAGDLNVARSPLDGYPRLRTTPYQHVRNRADFNVRFFSNSEAKRQENENDHERGNEQIGLGAVDIWRAIKGNERRYTYYSRGREWGSSCDRVDLIIVSKKLWEEKAVIGTGILDSVKERGPSDHVPLWIEVKKLGLGK